MKSIIKLLLSLLFLSQSAFSQTVNEKLKNWQHEDPSTEKFHGVASNTVYSKIDSTKPVQPIVVAVIDGGTDADHEDLKSNLWTNEKEIEGNGIDDDHNGYIDDIHGWNFIGENQASCKVYSHYSDDYPNLFHCKIVSSTGSYFHSVIRAISE